MGKVSDKLINHGITSKTKELRKAREANEQEVRSVVDQLPRLSMGQLMSILQTVASDPNVAAKLSPNDIAELQAARQQNDSVKLGTKMQSLAREGRLGENLTPAREYTEAELQQVHGALQHLFERLSPVFTVNLPEKIPTVTLESTTHALLPVLQQIEQAVAPLQSAQIEVKPEIVEQRLKEALGALVAKQKGIPAQKVTTSDIDALLKPDTSREAKIKYGLMRSFLEDPNKHSAAIASLLTEAVRMGKVDPEDLVATTQQVNEALKGIDLAALPKDLLNEVMSLEPVRVLLAIGLEIGLQDGSIGENLQRVLGNEQHLEQIGQLLSSPTAQQLGAGALLPKLSGLMGD